MLYKPWAKTRQKPDGKILDRPRANQFFRLCNKLKKIIDILNLLQLNFEKLVNDFFVV